MSNTEISAYVTAFLNKGGKITICPTRVAVATPQLRPLNERGSKSVAA